MRNGSVQWGQVVVLAIAFAGQLVAVNRTFPGIFVSLILLVAFLIALWRSVTRGEFTGIKDGEAIRPNAHFNVDLTSRLQTDGSHWVRYSWVLAVVISTFVVLQVFATDDIHPFVRFATAAVYGSLVGQIVLIATCGPLRTPTLALMTMATITSLAFVPFSPTISRQVTEASITICLFALVSNALGDHSVKSTGGRSRYRLLVHVALLLVVVLVIPPLTRRSEEPLQNLPVRFTGSIVDSELASYSRPSASRYVATASLDDIVKQYEIDPKGLALVVYGDQVPGYLRGRVFDTYDRGRWHHPVPRSYDIRRSIERGGPDLTTLQPVVLPSQKSPSSLSLTDSLKSRRTSDEPVRSAFAISAAGTGKSITFEIENDPKRGTQFFLPLHASRIDGVGDRIRLDRHQIVLDGIKTKHTYFATMDERPEETALDPLVRELSLQVSDGLASRLEVLAKNLAGSQTTARQKASRIAGYFQQNFKYSTKYAMDPRFGDPLLAFLNDRAAAHCEYFASATALLLRIVDVPTRYVTGYVVDEESDDSDGWFARNLDAHAWVEAYDDQTRQWFVVESTPGREYVELTFPSSSSSSDAISTGDSDEVSVEASQGWFENSRVWNLMKSGRWFELFSVLLESSRLPLFVVTVGLIAWLVRSRRLVRTNGKLGTMQDPYRHEYAKLLQNADRRMKRLGLSRSSTETLNQFAVRIERTLDKDENASTYAAWYRSLAGSRYRSLPPREELYRLRFDRPHTIVRKPQGKVTASC